MKMMTMINKDTMRSISTMNELKLLRKQLKGQVCYAEENIENDYYAIISGYRSWITHNIIQKGIVFSLGILLKKITGRR